MSNCVIKFNYKENEIAVKCSRSEQMRAIFDRFRTKAQASINNLSFFYGRERINPELILSQINAEDEEIKVLGIPERMGGNIAEKREKSSYIKNAQNDEPGLIQFLPNYELILADLKNNRRQLKLNEYLETQMIDDKKIKCSCCSKSKADSANEQFHFCFECQKILCSLCKSKHQEHKNIVDYFSRHFRCPNHQGQSFIEYCSDCKKNLCFFCQYEHKGHNTISLNDLREVQNKELNEKLERVKKEVCAIIDSLRKFMENLEIFANINSTLNEDLVKMNLNYQNLKTLKNIMSAEFLNKDIDQILKTKNQNEKFQKIMSVYDLMEGKEGKARNETIGDVIQNVEVKAQKSDENNNEIEMKVKVDENEVNKQVYFLDKDGCGHFHEHDTFKEIKETNAVLIIEGKEVPLKNSFIPKKSGVYSIKLIFKSKMQGCSFMFCCCKNIIEIDFSKFNTEMVTTMKCMFYCCTSLTSLDLSSFNITNLDNTSYMFAGCSSLSKLNFTQFNVENVHYSQGMYNGCTKLASFKISNTIKVISGTPIRVLERDKNEIELKVKIEEDELSKPVYFLDNTDGEYFENGEFFKHNHDNLKEINENNTTLVIGEKTTPFKKYFIPIKRGIYSIKLIFKNKLTNCAYMFCNCKNIIDFNFSKFNMDDVTDTRYMFHKCSYLTSLNLTALNTKNIVNMSYMFSGCTSLTKLSWPRFNVIKADTKCMFYGCKNLKSYSRSDKNVTTIFNEE